MIIRSILDPRVVKALNDGHTVVAKTDTIYGILARASDKNAVENLYRIRQRDMRKPSIILVSHTADIPKLDDSQKRAYSALSSEKPTTLTTAVPDNYLPHLPRSESDGSLAFRVIPQDNPLHKLIEKTGPLIAPSANTEGAPPAETIQDAQKYFGDQIPIYVDSGHVSNQAASRIIRILDNKIDIIRE